MKHVAHRRSLVSFLVEISDFGGKTPCRYSSVVCWEVTNWTQIMGPFLVTRGGGCTPPALSSPAIGEYAGGGEDEMGLGREALIAVDAAAPVSCDPEPWWDSGKGVLMRVASWPCPAVWWNGGCWY